MTLLVFRKTDNGSSTNYNPVRWNRSPFHKLKFLEVRKPFCKHPRGDSFLAVGDKVVGPAGAAEKEKEYKYDTGNRLRKEEKFKEDMVSEASTFAVDDVYGGRQDVRCRPT